MSEVTVNQFSKDTGIPRSKVYYQINQGNLKLNKSKINYEDALRLFISKGANTKSSYHENDTRQLLNTLTLQNLSLLKQLDRAYEREKRYLAELAFYKSIQLKSNTQDKIESASFIENFDQSSEEEITDKSIIEVISKSPNEIEQIESDPPQCERSTHEKSESSVQLKLKRPSKDHQLAKPTNRPKSIQVDKVQKKKKED